MNKKESLFQLLKTAPKCQLHLHLDGSLSFNFIIQTYERIKREDPIRAESIFPNNSVPKTKEELRDLLMEMKKPAIENNMLVKSCKNWQIFDFCNEFLQTFEDISRATYDLATRLYEEHHVNYIEIRFAPILHTLRGLTIEDAINAAVDGFIKAEVVLENKLYGGIILCALRSYPVVDSMKLLPLIESNAKVLGFDIAGDEGGFPLELFESTLIECKRRGIKTTVHAGEWPNSLHNVQLAAELGVNRIGHAISLGSASKELFMLIKEQNISVEVNLTANCGNPLKVSSFSSHPYSLMLKQGIKVAGLNCDNLLLSGNQDIGAPNPTIECVRALLDCEISVEQLLQTLSDGYKAGFIENSYHVEDISMTIWKKEIVPKLISLLIEKKNE